MNFGRVPAPTTLRRYPNSTGLLRWIGWWALHLKRDSRLRAPNQAIGCNFSLTRCSRLKALGWDKADRVVGSQEVPNDLHQGRLWNQLTCLRYLQQMSSARDPTDDAWVTKAVREAMIHWHSSESRRVIQEVLMPGGDPDSFPESNRHWKGGQVKHFRIALPDAMSVAARPGVWDFNSLDERQHLPGELDFCIACISSLSEGRQRAHRSLLYLPFYFAITVNKVHNSSKSYIQGQSVKWLRTIDYLAPDSDVHAWRWLYARSGGGGRVSRSLAVRLI
eukprot:5367696-Pleurochrysis_carterae.AAC.1